MNADYKICPTCNQPAVPQMQVCQRCGHVYSTPPPHPPNRTIFIQRNPYPFQPDWDDGRQLDTANVPMIVGMWVLTGCAMMGAAYFGMAAGVAFDIPALGCAIALVCTKNAANRANGWVKIGLEAAAFAFALMVGLQPRY